MCLWFLHLSAYFRLTAVPMNVVSIFFLEAYLFSFSSKQQSTKSESSSEYILRLKVQIESQFKEHFPVVRS